MCQYLIPEVDSFDSHILRQPVHEYKTFDPSEGNQHSLVGGNCAARASWQLFVQRQSNRTWRCVDKYPRLIARDNVPKVSLLLLTEDIKEHPGTLCPLIPQFAGQHIGAPFRVHTDNSMCHNGSKVMSKIKKHQFPECRTRPIQQI
jgi:hypothetical protein